MDAENGELKVLPLSTKGESETLAETQKQQSLEKQNPSEEAEQNLDAENLFQNAEITEEIQPIEQQSSTSPTIVTEKAGGKKKKLSLQERLALAAQKKSKNETKLKKKLIVESKQKEAMPDNITDDQINTSASVQQSDTMAAADDLKDLYQLIPTELGSQRDQLVSHLKDYVSKLMDNSAKNYLMKISKLEDELSSVVKPVSLSSTESELLKKLREKEQQINELIDEGTKLSKKELALNQSLKKMKLRETELEEDIELYEKSAEELNNKVELLEKKVVDFDDNERALVEEKLAMQTLRTKYDSLVRANESLTDELKEIKFSKLDIQLERALKELNKERTAHFELLDKHEKLNTLYNQTNEEKDVLILDLESQLRSEKDKCSDISRESEAEIKRLGQKIEALRFQSESAIPAEKSTEDTDMLQMQYDQAKENWKLIESSYLKKISNFEVQLEDLRKTNIIYSKKIKVLSNDLKQKSTSNSELQEIEGNLVSEIALLKKKNATLMSTNQTLEDNIKHLKEEFAKEKGSFEKKVQTLEEEKEGLESSLKLRTNDFTSSQQINQNSFYLQDLSSSSSLNHLKTMNNSTMGRSASNKRFSISVGESSTTPRLSTSNSSFSIHKLNSVASMSAQDKILRHQNSTISFNSNDMQLQQQQQQPLGISSSSGANNELISGGTGGSTPFLLESPSINNTSQDLALLNDDIPLGMDAESERVSTLNGGADTPNIGSGGGLNIQLIKKLSAHIRMLELEVTTLKDETKTLENEKDAASEEIVRLIQDNSQVQQVRDEVTAKEAEVNKLQKNYERVLILLGEKEERVGELTADVEDLKDMLRQQVQQMVDMQEKIDRISSNK
ncbi:hypothetical protein PMKS-003307 [Pichia membranifaciens]|uniref:TATA element modulatory factor 1 TATA binding domain-containing protein n=1 Tax=Pichia membranifaciens TaxID=4926 RepID=A0A1Q2YKA9_9ASCO|nr:hypothetical protein PMKS-003307 [Pichia membranifaciens]